MRATIKTAMLTRIDWTVGLLVTAAVVVLHVLFLYHAGPLWRDEIETFYLATLPSLSDIWSTLHLTPAPIFPNLVVRGWLEIPGVQTDFGLRGLGFVFGMLIIGSLWLDAHLLQRTIPLFSLVLFALHPLTIRSCDSIRNYGLGILFISLTIGLVWKLITSGRPWAFFAASLSAILSVQCLYQNAFLVLAICLSGIVVTIRDRMWKTTFLIGGVGLGSALSLLPYMGIIERAQSWTVLLQSPVKPTAILTGVATALEFPGYLYHMHWAWMGLCAIGIVASIEMYFTRTTGRNAGNIHWRLLLYAWLVILLSFTGYLGFVYFVKVGLRPWHYVPLLAVSAVSLDVILGITCAKSILRTIVAVFIFVFSFNTVWHYVHIRHTNVDLIASRLEESAAKNDLILLSLWYYGISFQRYYNGPASVMTIPPITDHSMHRFDLIKEKLMAENSIEPVLSKITATLKTGNRVWVIGTLPIDNVDEKPLSFPPAPDGPYGWHDDPYIYRWRMQVKYLIHSHAVRDTQIPQPEGLSINPEEHLPLRLIQGWRSVRVQPDTGTLRD